ncbi:unnamed protein product, partial [marine sediment metagenome]
MHGIRIPPKSAVKLGPEQLKEYNRQMHDLKYIRGHFIELIIKIEEDINKIIEKSMISKKSRFKTVFSEKILNSRSISLKMKIDIFEEIVRGGKYLRQDEQEEFFKSLKTLIVERNKWAHGPIFYQQDPNLKLQPYLQYINTKGKPSEQKLTKEYFDGLNKKLQTIHEKIEKVLIEMKL